MSDEIPDPSAAAAGQDAEVDPFRLPFRWLATSAQVGLQLTGDVVSRSLSVTRQVVEGARNGKSPGQLAGLVVEGTLDTIRGAVEVAAEHTPAAAEPVAELAQNVAMRIPEQVGMRLVQAGQLTTTLSGGSVRDVRRQLREQGQELLRRSTALDDPEEHPSFRAILRQLAPDEARIVRLLCVDGPQPVIDVIEHNGLTRDSREVSRHVSLIGREAGCIRPSLAPVYLDNLQRLGLVHIRDFRVGGQEAYDLLEAQPGVVDLPKVPGMFSRHRLLYKSVAISDFGWRLYRMCFAPEGEQDEEPADERDGSELGRSTVYPGRPSRTV